MIVASVFYPFEAGVRFDFDYYLERHVPLARRLLAEHGLRKLEVERGVSGEERGTGPRFACIARLFFDSADLFYAAMDAVGDELGADVANYTDVELDVQVSEVVS